MKRSSKVGALATGMLLVAMVGVSTADLTVWGGWQGLVSLITGPALGRPAQAAQPIPNIAAALPHVTKAVWRQPLADQLLAAGYRESGPTTPPGGAIASTIWVRTGWPTVQLDSLADGNGIIIGKMWLPADPQAWTYVSPQQDYPAVVEAAAAKAVLETRSLRRAHASLRLCDGTRSVPVNVHDLHGRGIVWAMLFFRSQKFEQCKSHIQGAAGAG